MSSAKIKMKFDRPRRARRGKPRDPGDGAFLERERLSSNRAVRRRRSPKRRIQDGLDVIEIRDYLKSMGSIYVPYKGSRPAAVTINGHRIIILTDDPADLHDHLSLVGADRVREIQSAESGEEAQKVIFKLADAAKAGVVMAPHELGVEDVINSLRDQLPWIQ